MGYRHSKEVYNRINDFVNDSENIDLPFSEMVTSIKAIIKSGESQAGQGKITSSSWDERSDIQVLKGHSQYVDPPNSPLVTFAIHWASSDKGGCHIAHRDDLTTSDQFIPFYSLHFREGFNESININGHITYFQTDSSQKKSKDSRSRKNRNYCRKRYH